MRFNFMWTVASTVFLVLLIETAMYKAYADQTRAANPLSYSPLSSDSTTPEPEGGIVTGGSYTNKYFALAYPLLPDWREDFKGPLPSNAGYYVLAAVRPSGELKGSVLITAQDLFFSSWPMNGSMDLLKLRQKQAVQSTLKIESPAREIKTGDHSFARLDYSGAGLLHAIFATTIRCHVLTFEITSRDPEILESLSQQMSRSSLPNVANIAAGGNEFPVCIKDYAVADNVIRRVDPVEVGPRFTRVPARIIIDSEGRVKHVHVLNAFPDQARSVQNALMQWTFKPYIQNGQPVEIETGILFEFGKQDKTHGAVVVAPTSRQLPLPQKDLP